MKIYTRTGDDGTTGLLFGGRVPKDGPLPTAYGDVDEAQAVIGVARAHGESGSELDELLIAVQRDLWVLMAELATAADNRHKLTPGASLVTGEMVEHLEAEIDRYSARFEPPTEFVVPGEDRVSAFLDLARTVVRRSERAALTAQSGEGARSGEAGRADGSDAVVESYVVRYLNRLSDLMWTLARWQEGESLTARRRPDEPSSGG